MVRLPEATKRLALERLDDRVPRAGSVRLRTLEGRMVTPAIFPWVNFSWMNREPNGMPPIRRHRSVFEVDNCCGHHSMYTSAFPFANRWVSHGFQHLRGR